MIPVTHKRLCYVFFTLAVLANLGLALLLKLPPVASTVGIPLHLKCYVGSCGIESQSS